MPSWCGLVLHSGAPRAESPVVNYLLAGTRVWLVDPEKQQVEDYIPGQSPKTIGMEGTLEGGEILPGFQLVVSKIFTAAG